MKTMNRNERRIAKARTRKHARQVLAEGYKPTKDRGFRDGIAKTVRAVDFALPEHLTGAGICVYRSLVGLEALRGCDIDAHLHVGSLLYRVGPDPWRDVIAFCGSGNAGATLNGLPLFHTWLDVEDDIVDFSVGDWPKLQCPEIFTGEAARALGPFQWTIPQPPNYWWRPYAELTRPWRSSGTPALNEAWYGPFNGDAPAMHRIIKKAQAELGQHIADAVETVMSRAAEQLGVERPPRLQRRDRFVDPPIITSDGAPPTGYQQTTFAEILRIAGLPMEKGMPDAVAFVSVMPTTAAEARAMLRNMSVTVPPGS
jgi:hypothetical protein